MQHDWLAHHHHNSLGRQTVFENYSASVQISGQRLNISLWDTAGQEDYDRIRVLSYPDTDVFVVAYSIGSRASFENVTERWLPELEHYAPSVPVVLVGLKSDLRQLGRDEVTTAEAERLANRIGAVAYREASPHTTAGVKEVFDAAITEYVCPASKKKKGGKAKKCSIL